MAKKRRVSREKYVARLREMDEEREAWLEKRKTRRQQATKTTRDEHSDVEDEIIVREGDAHANSPHASDDDAAPALVAAGATPASQTTTTPLSFQERLAQASKKGEQPMKKRRMEE